MTSYLTEIRYWQWSNSISYIWIYIISTLTNRIKFRLMQDLSISAGWPSWF